MMKTENLPDEEKVRQELEDLRQQLIAETERFDAAKKSVREWIDEIASNKPLKLHVKGVHATIKFFALEAIHDFQKNPTYEGALNSYAQLTHLVSKVLPPQMYHEHLGHITSQKEYYESYWAPLIKAGKKINASRILSDELYLYFYDVFHFLLSIEFITAEEARKAYDSFVASQERTLAREEERV